MFSRTPDEIIEILQYEDDGDDDGDDDDDDDNSDECGGTLDRFWHQGIHAWTWDDCYRVAAAARGRRTEITVEVDLMFLLLNDRDGDAWLRVACILLNFRKVKSLRFVRGGFEGAAKLADKILRLLARPSGSQRYASISCLYLEVPCGHNALSLVADNLRTIKTLALSSRGDPFLMPRKVAQVIITWLEAPSSNLEAIELATESAHDGVRELVTSILACP